VSINMSYEILVGLNVLDENKYGDYRSAMTPILASYKGNFGYDFRVSEVLLAQGSTEINRVFTITFPSKTNMESFFSDPQYLAVKELHFISSVGNVTLISSYEKEI